jgi:hypothetical protein
VLDARSGLAFIHLWADAAAGGEAMKSLHVAARILRGEIETRPPAV